MVTDRVFAELVPRADRASPAVDTLLSATDISAMNAFTAMVPHESGDFAPSYDVQLYLAAAGDVWIAECDALPIATEAATLDALVRRVWEIAPEIAELNGHEGKLKLRFTLNTAAPA